MKVTGTDLEGTFAPEAGIGDRAFDDGYLIAFEPMTAPTDALRADGFAVAEPGKPYAAAFTIAVH